MQELQDIGKLHGIYIPHQITKKTVLTYFHNHHCSQCDLYVSVLTEHITNIKIGKKNNLNDSSSSEFPPNPPSEKLIEKIITGFCNDTAPENFVEAGCAVCGQLSPIREMIPVNEIKYDLSVISPNNIGCQERFKESDPIISLNGPILAENCKDVCNSCLSFLKKEQKPPQSLANHFWIGSVPPALQILTFAEKMLIARI